MTKKKKKKKVIHRTNNYVISSRIFACDFISLKLSNTFFDELIFQNLTSVK